MQNTVAFTVLKIPTYFKRLLAVGFRKIITDSDFRVVTERVELDRFDISGRIYLT